MSQQIGSGYSDLELGRLLQAGQDIAATNAIVDFAGSCSIGHREPTSAR
jgi:hypothetical protein